MLMLFSIVAWCAWLGFGVAIMFVVDTCLEYRLTYALHDWLPAASPRWAPQLLLSLFWPIGLVWALLSK